APADRHDERLLPTFRAEPLERRQRRGPGGDHPRVLARARLADDTARAEGGPGEGVGPTAHGTRVQPRPMPPRPQRAPAAPDAHASRRNRSIARPTSPAQQRDEW